MITSAGHHASAFQLFNLLEEAEAVQVGQAAGRARAKAVVQIHRLMLRVVGRVVLMLVPILHREVAPGVALQLEEML